MKNGGKEALIENCENKMSLVLQIECKSLNNVSSTSSLEAIIENWQPHIIFAEKFTTIMRFTDSFGFPL